MAALPRSSTFRQLVGRRELMRDGPVVELWVGVSVQQEDVLADVGVAAPAPIRLSALIDTGAAMSAIPLRIAQQLAITAKGRVSVAGYSGTTERHLTFDVRLFTGPGGAHVKTMAFGVDDGTDEPFQALIGRDVLDQCVLTYHGIAGEITLTVMAP